MNEFLLRWAPFSQLLIRIILADIGGAVDADQHLSSDGVHLDDEGYEIMGTVYYQAVTAALIEQQE